MSGGLINVDFRLKPPTAGCELIMIMSGWSLCVWWWFLYKDQRVHPFHSPSSLYHQHHHTHRDHPLMESRCKLYVSRWHATLSKYPMWYRTGSKMVACHGVHWIFGLAHIMTQMGLYARASLTIKVICCSSSEYQFIMSSRWRHLTKWQPSWSLNIYKGLPSTLQWVIKITYHL